VTKRVVRKRTPFIFLFLAVLIGMSAHAASADEEYIPIFRPHLTLPITVEASIIDLVSELSTTYVDSSAAVGIGFDAAFTPWFDWNIVKLAYLGSTGLFETMGSFREFGAVSVTSTPGLRIPLNKRQDKYVHVFGGLGFSESLGGYISATNLSTGPSLMVVIGAEVVGPLQSRSSKNWTFQGFGFTYTNYVSNTPVSSIVNLGVHATLTYNTPLFSE
jgi:hypothetical protein